LPSPSPSKSATSIVRGEEDVNSKPAPNDSDGIGTGCIVGIVVAVVLLCALLIALIAWCLRDKRKVIEDDGGGQ
jgi:hypothetical protein